MYSQILLLLTVFFFNVKSAPLPCRLVKHLYFIDCSNRRLTSIPQSVLNVQEKDSLVLDLSENVLLHVSADIIKQFLLVDGRNTPLCVKPTFETALPNVECGSNYEADIHLELDEQSGNDGIDSVKTHPQQNPKSNVYGTEDDEDDVEESTRDIASVKGVDDGFIFNFDAKTPFFETLIDFIQAVLYLTSLVITFIFTRKFNGKLKGLIKICQGSKLRETSISIAASEGQNSQHNSVHTPNDSLDEESDNVVQ